MLAQRRALGQVRSAPEELSKLVSAASPPRLALHPTSPPRETLCVMADAPATHEVHVVVGGVGFLGSSIVRLLLGRGESHVVVFDLREPSADERALSAPDAGSAKAAAEYITGDLTSPESVAAALEKAAALGGVPISKVVVYHTASPVAGLGPGAYEKVNVQGTQNLLGVCKTVGVQKFVYTSSAGVLFTGDDLVYVDETLPFPKQPMDAYNDTKVSHYFPPTTTRSAPPAMLTHLSAMAGAR